MLEKKVAHFFPKVAQKVANTVLRVRFSKVAQKVAKHICLFCSVKGPSYRAMVVKWSASSLSTSTKQVRILMKPSIIA